MGVICYKRSEKYNAKRGFEPTKTLDFRIDVSLFFMFLSDFSLGEHFWSVKVPTYAKQMRLGAILNPRASKSTHLNHIFGPGGSKWCNPVIEGEPTRHRPGRDLAPKTLQGCIGIAPGSFFNRFWKDFGHIMNSPGHRPIGVLDPLTCIIYRYFILLIFIYPFLYTGTLNTGFYLLIIRARDPPWGHWRRNRVPSLDTRRPCGSPLTPTGQFLLIFRRLKATSKNQRFFEFSKIVENGRINRPLGAQGRILDQNPRLLGSILASIFHFFSKVAKV